jgi:hypothetical protein
MQLLCSLFDGKESGRARLLRAALLLLLLAASAYRVWLVFRDNPLDHISSDAARHWEAGVNALSSAPMVLIDPVMYQIYLGILAKLTMKVPVLVAAWTALLSLSGPWLWYRFLRELLPTRDCALVGWVLLAALPSWSAIYSHFMQETLMLPLLGAALWATWRCRRKGDRASFLVAVGAWLLAGLTRGICLPLAAVAMSWLWMVQGDKLGKAGTSMALVLACLAPLAARNWAMTGLLAPHGNGELAQLYARAGTMTMSIDFKRGESVRATYKFLSPALEHPPFEPFSGWRTRRAWDAHFSIDQNAGSRDWRAAKDSLPPWDLQRLGWITGENLVHLFFSRTWPDTDLERGIGQVNYWLRWLWAPLTVVCLVVTLATWRRQRERLLPALILTWFVFQGLLPIAVNEGRYRKPFEGLLIAQCLLLLSGGGRRASSAGDKGAASHRQTVDRMARGSP